MDSNRRHRLQSAGAMLPALRAAGPGTERSDEEILADLIYSLQRDARVDISGICVSVQNGIACLSGEIDSPEACRILYSIAHRTPGIVHVHDGVLIQEDDE